MNYIVRKKFKYGGAVLQPGEEFIPRGGKYDESIVEQGTLVVMVDDRMKQRKLKRLGIGKKFTEPIAVSKFEEPVKQAPKRGRPSKKGKKYATSKRAAVIST